MERTDSRTMTELADAAFQQAAKKVIEKAIQTKTPVIVWENGVIKKIDVSSEKHIDGNINTKDADVAQ
ncbi:MAG: hypothetical protein JWP89_1424 [Schlesneria sp.]|nr:hypothetical protein [Schlesneria sp.]